MAAPPDVQHLLDQHEFLKVVESSKGDSKHLRIKCEITQHELVPCVDVIEQHLKSKKFVKARDWYNHDYSQYEPYIVPHRKLPKQLYCNVTGTVLNRIPFELEKHVQGKRYKRLKPHVKIKVTTSGDDEMQSKEEFDADAFELEHGKVLYSDDEKHSDREEETERAESINATQDQECDDFADLYPKDDFDTLKNEDSRNHKNETNEKNKKEVLIADLTISKKRSGAKIPKSRVKKTKQTY
ncbi:hypothetical protein CCR75_001677 [Bremia lactucae]|uniref:Surfeit locus protein 2 n=1 Tax=Bremia lactucae TaxID=4779 RepID=A0A976ICK9_BRELC|nr:hypothetical protein CCR75_001677 [Bremia lactucae]